MTQLFDKINRLPLSPGVYLFKDQEAKIIYIGKARRLKRRVKQYFARRQINPKTRALVAEIVDLDYIELETELDALFLEAELVKRYRPRYNILLRDDKSSIYIKLTSYKTVPDISLVRLPNDERARYFGPYFNAYPVRQALRCLRQIFPYFNRNYDAKQRLSLERQIGLEPDVSTVAGQQKYQQDLQQIVRFIRGERLKVVADLERAMLQAAKIEDFEMAASYRNKLQQLAALQQRIKLDNFADTALQFDDSLDRLKNLFGLAAWPERIEGFDISHLGGTNVVASQVVFISGVPNRSLYRHYKMKYDQNNDYYNMAELMRRRFGAKNLNKNPVPDLILIDGGKGQLSSAIEELQKLGWGKIPILALAEKFEELVISPRSSNLSIPPWATKFLENQEQFLLLRLTKSDSALRLLERVRDEAHRFAISYQTKLTRAKRLHSQLDDIRGIGPKTRAKLQSKLSLSDIAVADFNQLSDLIGPARAKIVWQYFATEKAESNDKTTKNATME